MKNEMGGSSKKLERKASVHRFVTDIFHIYVVKFQNSETGLLKYFETFMRRLMSIVEDHSTIDI